ncbi:MAG: heme/copper-type cytochrome/quinol oxidase subunit [Planctomycetota bacterium]|nr:MAG: heme/copper-type cytochrome/quinol oxidase subunit [Planctomycetota bacterium]
MVGLRSVAAFLAISSGCGPDQSEKPIDTLTVEVTGRGMEWIVRYPGEDGVLGSADDVTDRQNLHVPAGADTTVVLKSADYVYSFSLPAFEAREIAVPDLVFSLRFKPETPGEYELQGDNMCGGTHSALKGKLIVEPAYAFRAWLKERRK